jgi:hypothetical protein
MSSTIKAAFLLFLLFVCGAALMLAHKTREQVSPPPPRELFSAVNQQLTAFRSTDFRSAYRQAATGVQQKFTAQQFEEMVRHNYPEITRTRRVEFGLVKVNGTSAMVQVFFLAADGRGRCFLYNLIREKEQWKVDGVVELDRFEPNEFLAGSRV